MVIFWEWYTHQQVFQSYSLRLGTQRPCGHKCNIWLLNSDTLLVESSGSSSSHSVFTLFGDNFMHSCGPSGMWNAVKVLYQPCIKNRNKDLADAWENDFGVHPLKFPSETCLELLLMLSLSTASLPPSLQRMNSFQVAFLKMWRIQIPMWKALLKFPSIRHTWKPSNGVTPKGKSSGNTKQNEL